MVRQEIKNFFMDYGEHKGLKCVAPCSLCSVLYENNLMGDPSVSDNAAQFLKLGSGECVFFSEFEITPLVMSMKNVFLRFYGLDTLCKIEVNGHAIASVDNMHRTYDFEVKTKLNLGKNLLKLTFTRPDGGEDLRKSYFSFGKEGSAYLPDMGIFRKIEIVAFNHKIISDVRVKQTHSDGSVRLDLSVRTVGYDELSRTVATLTSAAGNVYFCGFVGTEGSITVNDPNLWWPNGLGMQNLYKLNVNLYSESEIEDTYEMKIGLRTVSVEQNGQTGRLIVNGVPVLAMGGEYMSEDILTSRLTEKRTRTLLEGAKNANFNSILVHGSGYYPENYFFDACDELGLMVWQQLPLTAKSEADSDSVRESIKQEISENITRIAHHPSLCVVIGNERVKGLFSSKNEADRFASSFSDFDGMNVFDVEGKCEAGFVRVGYPSVPTYDTVLKLAEPHRRNLGSDVFELHGADKDSVMTMLTDAFDSYPYANGMRELSYVMGLSSASLSKKEVERIRRGENKPLAIFMRRMNDPWPSLSPSAIDYYGNKKPLHYFEREYFLPVNISVEQNGTRVKFIASNDSRHDYVGVFAYAIMNNKNQPVFRDSFPIRARSSSRLEVHNVDIGSVIRGHEDEYYLLYSVSDKSNEASKGIHLFTKTKRFKFLRPNYSIEIIGNGMEYTATVGADCFAQGVEISFDSENVSLDKNYFDITGKAPVRLRLTTPRMTTIEKLRRVMKIRSVYDIGYEEDSI